MTKVQHWSGVPLVRRAHPGRAICAKLGDPLPMDNKPDQLNAILEAVRHGEERSRLFWWMVKHHDDLIAAAKGNRMRWTPLCATFTALGFTDTAGKPHTKRGAREIWLQARSYVSKRRAARERAETGKTQPSRFPVTWRPPVVEPPRPVEQPWCSPADRSKEPAVELNDAARETLASLQRQLDHSDRFLFMPKRKD